MMVLIKK